MLKLHRRFVASMLLVILIGTISLPIGVAQARVQNISISKLVDETHYKETLFIITTNEATYHILVTAKITAFENETLIELKATLINPHNTTITASARIPDTLYDAPYFDKPVEAISLHLQSLEAIALKIALAAIFIAALVGQVLLIIPDTAIEILKEILNILLFGEFIWASIPWVFLTLLSDTNPDESVDLYIPYSPLSVHRDHLLGGFYYVATSINWWKIVKREVRFLWFVLFTYYVAEWVCSRVGPPLPKSPSASFEWFPLRPTMGEEVNFTSTSFDPDGNITESRWWFGDGDQATGGSVKHIYTSTGNFTVVLNVTDNDGLIGTANYTLEIQPRPEAKLRIYPDHLWLSITVGSSGTAKFVACESLNQTDVLGVVFVASEFISPDGTVICPGNVSFDKNNITVTKGSYANLTMSVQAPSDLPSDWYNGNITALSQNGGNDTIFVDLNILPLNTPVGTNVTVTDPATGIIIKFDSVTGSGETTVVTTGTGPPPPSGFRLVPSAPPIYYEITTTANYTGMIEVSIPYNETQVQSEDNLKLMHWSETEKRHVDVTTWVDKENNTIHGRVSSLSPFTIMESLPPPPPPAVGGVVVPVSKLGLFAPEIVLGLLILSSGVAVFIKRGKRQQ